jgi:FKBP-type peptidyl-prolyl cis-trans isomerase 2
MGQVKEGDAVSVHYTGKLPDGTVFDSSRDREPLQVKVGAGEVIPGFEQGLVGMEVGDNKTVTLTPDEAYGYRREDLIVDVDANQFPENIKPRIGQRLQVRQPDGSLVNVQITGIEDGTVTLDANHPLAGETLIFDIELVAIN